MLGLVGPLAAVMPTTRSWVLWGGYDRSIWMSILYEEIVIPSGGASWWGSVSVLPPGRALHGVGFVPHYNGAFGRFCYLFLLVSGAKYWTRCPRALFFSTFLPIA